MTKPMIETRITKGIGKHSGDGECGFISLDGEATQVTTRTVWKKKKIIEKKDVELAYEELFPNEYAEGKFCFEVVVRVEYFEKPSWW